MFLLTRPSDSFLRDFMAGLRDSELSYAQVGATASSPPPRHFVDHTRIQLGSGERVWQKAVEAIQSWQMFNIGWTQLCWPDAPIRVGANVGVVIRHYGFYSLNAARIVYVVDDEVDHIRRFGFAYGTLLEHAESGEERFLVEWNRVDGTVWYDLFTFSRPAHILAKLGLPLARSLQKQFAKDSKARMLEFVS